MNISTDHLNKFGRLSLPWLLVAITVYSCPPSENPSGSSETIKPSPTIFMAVWLILIILLGFAWMTNWVNQIPYSDWIFGATSTGLALWMYLFNCAKQRKNALYVLVLLYALALMSVIVTQEMAIRILLCCYVAWLSFAIHLNIKALDPNDLKN